VASRFQDWLRALTQVDVAGANLAPLSARGSTLVGRAQIANLLAERSFRPSEPWPFPGADAVACELAREAIYWSLLALHEQARSAAPSPAEAEPAGPDALTLTTLWAEAPAALLEQAAEGAEQVEQVRAELLGKSFADFTELDPDQQASAAARLHAFADRLIEPLALPRRAQERAWAKRIQLLVAAVVVLVALGFALNSLRAPTDLAPSASWHASSHFAGECECQSPEQTCASCPNFFFHTVEEDHPSVVFDLHRVESISAVEVGNRIDCCSDRALPLLVQVSTDRKRWKTVATRTEAFTDFRADFPTERARWVKLSVGRRDFLHLRSVRLLP
jgi:hypothetical protein